MVSFGWKRVREVVWMLGERLRLLRRQAGLRQAELAAAVGVSASAIGMYEQGRRRPRRAVLLRLCAYFELSPRELAGEGRTPADGED